MMNTTKINARTVCAAFAAVLALLPFGISRAATTLWAGPLNPDPGVLYCFATNVSDEALDIEIGIVAVDGALSPVNTTLDPGETTFVGAVSADTPRLCRFTFAGAKRRVEASVCVSHLLVCDGAAVAAY